MQKTGGVDHAVLDELKRNPQRTSRDRLATVATFRASCRCPLDVSRTGPARVLYTDRGERLELLKGGGLRLGRLGVGEGFQKLGAASLRATHEMEPMEGLPVSEGVRNARPQAKAPLLDRLLTGATLGASARSWFDLVRHGLYTVGMVFSTARTASASNSTDPAPAESSMLSARRAPEMAKVVGVLLIIQANTSW